MKLPCRSLEPRRLQTCAACLQFVRPEKSLINNDASSSNTSTKPIKHQQASAICWQLLAASCSLLAAVRCLLSAGLCIHMLTAAMAAARCCWPQLVLQLLLLVCASLCVVAVGLLPMLSLRGCCWSVAVGLLLLVCCCWSVAVGLLLLSLCWLVCCCWSVAVGLLASASSKGRVSR